MGVWGSRAVAVGGIDTEEDVEMELVMGGVGVEDVEAVNGGECVVVNDGELEVDCTAVDVGDNAPTEFETLGDSE